jgi:hypothetical protein
MSEEIDSTLINAIVEIREEEAMALAHRFVTEGMQSANLPRVGGAYSGLARLSASLFDMQSGLVIAACAKENPQSAFGVDEISRTAGNFQLSGQMVTLI